MYITFVSYPESMTEDINELIEKVKDKYLNIKYWSILHDKDINENGEIKKAHYHNVLDIDFKNKSHTIYEKEDIAKMFAISVGQIEKVSNPTGIVRYLIHCDNNDKYQYTLDDVITNDFDTIKNAIQIEPKEKKAEDTLEELFQWIDTQCLVTPLDLFRYQRTKKLFFKFSAVSKQIEWYRQYHNSLLGDIVKDNKVTQYIFSEDCEDITFSDKYRKEVNENENAKED